MATRTSPAGAAQDGDDTHVTPRCPAFGTRPGRMPRDPAGGGARETGAKGHEALRVDARGRPERRESSAAASAVPGGIARDTGATGPPALRSRHHGRARGDMGTGPSSLLIANRGEIAIRIARAAAEHGLQNGGRLLGGRRRVPAHAQGR